jgi:hypothetical protein
MNYILMKILYNLNQKLLFFRFLKRKTMNLNDLTQ